MPQLQLPMFPAGVTEINSQIAVQKEAGRGFYLHGHLPVFQHEEQDVRSFRMFTSQMIAGGTVKPKEIVKTFGVPMVTVKRYVKVYRDHGSKGFYASQPRHSSVYQRPTSGLCTPDCNLNGPHRGQGFTERTAQQPRNGAGRLTQPRRRREDTGRDPRAYQEDLRNRTGQNPGSDALQTCQQGHNVLQDRRRPLRITRAQGNHGRGTDANHSGRIADNRESKRGLVLRPLLLWLLSSLPMWH